MSTRICKLCKINKSISDFEPYGKNYRQQCRQCRGAALGNNAVTLQVATALQQQHDSIARTETSLLQQNESIARAETHAANTYNSVNELLDRFSELENLSREQVSALAVTNAELTHACREMQSFHERIGDDINNIKINIQDLIVASRDPKIRDELKAIHDDIETIYRNTRPARPTTRTPPINSSSGRSPISSPVNSPGHSPKHP